jgi:YD repeat-containing protein
MAHDQLERLTSQTDSNNLRPTFTCDAADDRTSVQASPGETTTSVYNNLERHTRRP